MPTDVSLILVSGAGLFGALTAFIVGARFTRNLRVLGWGSACSAIAVAGLAHFVWSWCTRGFDPLHAWVPPLACLVLLLVMTAQGWFVFYEDGRDAADSSTPSLVLLAAAAGCVICGFIADAHSPALPIIWASAGSLALLLSIQPVQRSIAINRSVSIGVVVGIFKLLVPLTGILVFVLVDMMTRPGPVAAGDGASVTRKRSRSGDNRDSRDSRDSCYSDHYGEAGHHGDDGLDAHVNEKPRVLFDLLALLWQIGLLPLLTLTNGARVTPHPATFDPLEFLLEGKGGHSVTGQMPRSTRNTVVMILVVAVHVLCGVMIVKH
jgi:hypothetical protein